MGLNNCFFIIGFMFCLCQSRFIQGMDQRYNSDFLNVFLRNHAYTNVVRPRTGTLYHLSLPSNFSGIEASFARFRSKSFHSNGVNFSSIDIPPNTWPSPFVRRFDIIYENLGNWSSYYFNVPNYTLVSPVIGFSVYNGANPNTTKNSSIHLSSQGSPILVHFPRIIIPKREGNATLECVRFDMNGSVEITNTTSINVCITRQEGHYALVIRPSFRLRKKKNEMFWKWWVIGFGVGIIGVVTLALLGVLVYKFVKRKSILQMENESERNEALGTTWVGSSRLPSANGIRTQPVLMNEDSP